MIHKLMLPSPVLRGIEMINQGEYFRAHELLEFAWTQETGKIRQLYQGLVQVSVMLYHLERNNYTGALKLLVKAINNLSLFKEYSCCLDVQGLLTDLFELNLRLSEQEKRLPADILSHSFRLRYRH